MRRGRRAYRLSDADGVRPRGPRRIFDGLLIVAGGIADAHGDTASLALGGDIACMGTRFIATPESGVVEDIAR